MSSVHDQLNMSESPISLYNQDCIEGMCNLVSDESVDLVIADPPYFKVSGEKWDRQWRTESEYLDWCKIWLSELNRCMRYGGTLYLFGYFRMLTHIIPIAESMGFALRQQIIIDKGMKAISGRATKNYKQFPCVTESILFFIKDPIPFSRALLKERQIATGKTSREINDALGVRTNGGGMWSIYSGDNVCEQLPTKDQWEKLQKSLEFHYPYSRIGVTFNPMMGISDVWRDIDFYEECGLRIHPTQKPIKLIERLVKSSSREGDLVLDPFMGSGASAVVSKANHRRFIGFECDSDYFSKCKQRVESYKALSDWEFL